MAGEDVFEPVEREVIAILAGDRLGKEAGTGEPLVDRLRRLVRDRNVLLASATRVAKPRVDDDMER